MDSTKVSRATKDSCYFIVNSKGQALARRAKYAQFYFTQISGLMKLKDGVIKMQRKKV